MSSKLVEFREIKGFRKKCFKNIEIREQPKEGLRIRGLRMMFKVIKLKAYLN